MDWVPVVFITFKVIVFGTCMFYAIKWHHDQGKKAKEEARLRKEAVERAAAAIGQQVAVPKPALAADQAANAPR